MRYAEAAVGRVAIYRLPHVFGKWSRPNYNSVVATFCHNIARGLPITITDPTRELNLAYIDDVMALFMAELEQTGPPGAEYRPKPLTHKVTLGRLAELIGSFKTFAAPWWCPISPTRWCTSCMPRT